MADVEDKVEEEKAEEGAGNESEPEGNEPAIEDKGEAGEQDDPFKKRLGQVWARAKTAERQNQQLREEKAALEAENRVRKEVADTTPKTTNKVYGWAELEPLIEAGTMTRAAAQDYREGILLKEAEDRATKRAQEAAVESTKLSKVDTELGRFTKAIPNLRDKSSREFTAVAQAYSDLVQLHGAPKNKADEIKFELSACKQAFGSVESLEKRKDAADGGNAVRDTYQETSGGNRPLTKTDKDSQPKGLTPREIDYYERGFKNGTYKGWAEVNVEISEYNKRKGLK